MSDKRNEIFQNKENSFHDNWLVDANNSHTKQGDLTAELEGLNLGFDSYLYKGIRATPKNSDSRLGELKDFISDDLFEKIEHGSPIKSKRGRQSRSNLNDLYFLDEASGNSPSVGNNLEEASLNNKNKKFGHSLFFNNMNEAEAGKTGKEENSYFSRDAFRYSSQNEVNVIRHPDQFPQNYENMYNKSNNNMNGYFENREAANNGNNFESYANFEKFDKFGNPNMYMQDQQEARQRQPLTKLGNYNDITFIPKSYMPRAGIAMNNNGNAGLRNSMPMMSSQNELARNANSPLNKHEMMKVGSNSSLNGNQVPNIANDNKSFMYGKIGWVCSMCKNFNYESIFFF